MKTVEADPSAADGDQDLVIYKERMGKIVKKLVSFLLVFCFLASFLSFASADSDIIETLKSRDNFSYDDESHTSWTYYQTVEKELDDGITVEMLAAEWGYDADTLWFPEYRFFASDAEGTEFLILGATIVIDGNVFDLTLADLELDLVVGSGLYLTRDTLPFLKSLANTGNLYAVLRYDGGTLTLFMSEEELAPLKLFAADLVAIEYTEHISGEELDYEAWYQEETPLISYIVHDPDTGASDRSASPAALSGWTEYPLPELGLKVCLPSDFQVFTRGMDPADPTVLGSGLTPAEIDQILEEGNFYLEATMDDFVSEVFVTMIASPISDFSDYSDEMLLSMSSTWTSVFEPLGVEILDTAVFEVDGVKYVRFQEHMLPPEGGESYRVQYYTTVNKQAINLVFVSNYDEMTEAEQIFMRTVVENAVFSSDMDTADTVIVAPAPAVEEQTTLREYTVEQGPFTVMLDDGSYNILFKGMTAEEPALLRSGLTLDRCEWYMSSANKDLILYRLEDQFPAPFEISIRIKDNKYSGVDLRTYSPADAAAVLDTLYASFVTSGAENKENVTINGVPYLKFDWQNGAQQRYATIVNGDMIYIWAERGEGEFTEEELLLLRQVVESISYP